MASLKSPLASFSGTSRFASSLHQVLTRAIGIAALPLHSLDARQTTLNDRLSGLQKLDVRFSSLQASLGAIQRMIGSGVLSSSVSNGSVISAAIESGAGAGVYSIEVEDLGSSSSALSVAGTTPVTDPGQQGLNAATS